MLLELRGRCSRPSRRSLSLLLILVCPIIYSDTDLISDSQNGLSCYEAGMASPT